MTRIAVVDDAAAIARVHVRSWQQAYRGLLPQDFLDALDPASRTAGWRSSIASQSPPTRACVVLADSDHVLGFAHVCPTRDDDAGVDIVGELTSIYLHPDVWGRGFGRQLMTHALGLLRDAGNTAATLWVLAGNLRASTFYERTGWTPDGATKDAVVAGATVRELRYRTTL